MTFSILKVIYKIKQNMNIYPCSARQRQPKFIYFYLSLLGLTIGVNEADDQASADYIFADNSITL